jgi:hypothetical protein
MPLDENFYVEMNKTSGRILDMSLYSSQKIISAILVLKEIT